MAGGFEESKDGGAPIRRTRVPVAEFVTAIKLATKDLQNKLERDEVECMLANMIYKVRLKHCASLNNICKSTLFRSISTFIFG